MNNISVNVFGYENKRTIPVYLTSFQYDNIMNSLLISDNNNQYYVYIKDFNRFMNNITKTKGKKHFCVSCLRRFSSEKLLNEHKTS